MGERKYLNESSMEMTLLGDTLDVMSKVASSLKEVTNRVITNPNSELQDVACIIPYGDDIELVPIKVADLVALRLPVGAVGISFVFSSKGNKSGEPLYVITINLVVESLEVVGKRNAVVDLCAWLNVPLSVFS